MLRRLLLAALLLLPVSAWAQLPCSAYPNTLTNGTLADANQVMANFNTIRNCVNSLSPLGEPIAGTVSNTAGGLASAGTSVTVTADSVVVGTALNGTLYTLTSFSQALNTANTGAGGMDTGTTPGSTFVAIYAIYNPSAPSTSILATSCASSCPTIYAGAHMPAGYTASALLCTWPTNSTPALVAGYCRGKSFQYQTLLLPLNSSSTAKTSPTQLTISADVPPNAIAVSGYMANDSDGVGGTAYETISVGSDSTNAVVQLLQVLSVTGTGANYASNFTDLQLPTAQTIWYQTGSNTNAHNTATIAINAYKWP